METLATYIRDRRMALRMTQEELADRAGVSQPVISDIERGQTKLPSADARRGLARVFGVRHVDLLVAAGELSLEEVPGPTLPVRDLADPYERLCDLLAQVDLTTDRREASLVALLESFRAQDRTRRHDADTQPASA